MNKRNRDTPVLALIILLIMFIGLSIVLAFENRGLHSKTLYEPCDIQYRNIPCEECQECIDPWRLDPDNITGYGGDPSIID